MSIGKGHGWDVVLHTLCFHLTGRLVGSLFSWCFWEDLKVVLSIFIVMCPGISSVHCVHTVPSEAIRGHSPDPP